MFSTIYAITDPTLLPGAKLIAAVGEALSAGIKLIQYRDKDADEDSLLENAIALTRLCENHGAHLIVNDRIDIAARAGAHGVHLGQEDGDLSHARDLLGPQALLGRTCHASLELALKAQSQGANYVAFGRFFASATKPEAPAAALDLLSTARRSLKLPIVAIGGITRDNMPQVLSRGADCVALCHTLFGADNIAERAGELLNIQDTNNKV